nr:protein kinase-like domain-containing protein [Tanacetum cinerariifolium]
MKANAKTEDPHEDVGKLEKDGDKAMNDQNAKRLCKQTKSHEDWLEIFAVSVFDCANPTMTARVKQLSLYKAMKTTRTLWRSLGCLHRGRTSRLIIRKMVSYLKPIKKIKSKKHRLITRIPHILVADEAGIKKRKENSSIPLSITCNDVVNVKVTSMEKFIRRLSLAELKMATNNFDNKNAIGYGNMGIMYKSMFPNNLLLAIKRLCRPQVEAKKMDWVLRYKIAVGIARGLSWLHNNNVLRVAHLKITPKCILLDDKFEPKISNFGNSIILMNTSGIPSSGCNFVVPRASPSPYKEDVYSFRMLLLELIIGKRNNPLTDYRCGLDVCVINEYLMGQGFDEEIYKTHKIAESCIQARRDEATTMLQVYQAMQAIEISRKEIAVDLCIDVEDNEGISRKEKSCVLVVLVYFVSSNAIQSDIACLRSIKNTLEDPENLLSSWDFNNNTEGFICRYTGVECWHADESTVLNIHLSDMGLRGPFPMGLRNCTSLTGLDLSSNHLTGPIPSNLDDTIRYVTSLDLSNNNLSGPIPANLGNCSFLTALRLNNNHLTGQIPPELGGLLRLRKFSIANNSLIGQVPIFRNFTASPPCYAKKPRTLWSEGSKITTMEKFICRMSLEELNMATNSFDNKKVIGHGNMGIMYKAMFPSGLQLAVKRLHKFESFEKEFLLEIEILGKLRHINLVPLLDASPSPYKEDVFRFGVLLHELVTGREPSTWINSPTDHVGRRELIMIDESLMGQGFDEEIRETLKVAEKCIRAQTDGEIYMLQVYQEMHAIRISSKVISVDLSMDIEGNQGDL